MPSTEVIASLRELLAKEAEGSQPSSPSSNSHTCHSDSSESYAYLSSRDPTKSDLSSAARIDHISNEKAVPQMDHSDDLSIQQIHLLLKKTNHLKRQPLAKTTIGSSTPAPALKTVGASSHLQAQQDQNGRFNFKPNVNLIGRHFNMKPFQNSPLSQSTPLIVSSIPQKTSKLKKNSLSSALSREAESLSETSTDEGEVESNNRASEGAVKDGSHHMTSPETTPPTSNGDPMAYTNDKTSILDHHNEHASDQVNEAHANSDFYPSKRFDSESVASIAHNTSAGRSVDNVSSTSLPGSHKSHNSMVSSSPIRPFMNQHEDDEDENETDALRTELEILKSKLEESTELLARKDNKIEELKKANETQAQEMEGLTEFLATIIGNEEDAITKDFLLSNNCESLYDSLKLNEVDQLTFIELQNTLKEIVISLQLPYDNLTDIILKMTKFFREDYIRLIVFIKTVHDGIYKDTKLKLPDVYKLNWTVEEKQHQTADDDRYAGMEGDDGHDEAQIVKFDKCLKELAFKISKLAKNKRTLDSSLNQWRNELMN